MSLHRFVPLMLFILLMFMPAAVLAAGTVILPAGLKVIEDEAFLNDPSFDSVRVPFGVESIGDKAFSDNGTLTIYLPDSVSKISENAFENTQVIGVGDPDSYAAAYFEKKGFGFSLDVSGVEILENGSITVIQGEKVQLHAAVLPEEAGKNGVGWTVENPDIAVIDDNGLLTGVRPGWTAVYATSMDDITYHDAIAVMVQKPADAVGLFLVPADLNLVEEQTVTLTAMGPKSGNGQKLSWASDNPQVASVSQQGSVTGKSAGSTTIRVSYLSDPGVYAECSVTVEPLGAEQTWGDFVFRIDHDECCITGYTGSEREIEFPGSINGYPVTSIDVKTVASDSHPWSISSLRRCKGFVIPNTVTSIGSDTFYNLYLDYITTPDGEKKQGCITLPDGITSIGRNAFAYIQGIDTINLPESLSVISEEAFSNNSARVITFPDGIDTISDRAFMNCIYLREVHFPSRLKTVGNEAFEGCWEIREITLPEGATSIGDKAFSYCKKLTKAILPTTVTHIGTEAFSFCEKLQEVTLPNSSADISQDVFKRSTNIRKVYHPEGSAYSNELFPGGGITFIPYTPETVPEQPDPGMTVKDLYMGVGMKAEPVPVFSDLQADASLVSYSTKDQEIVSISNGVITAKKPGDAWVFASVPSLGIQTSFMVRVRSYIQPGELSLKLGETGRLASGTVVILNGSPEDNPPGSGKVEWSSSDENVVTVTGEGKVTAVGKGEAEIQCKHVDSEVWSVCKVKVSGEVKLTLSSETWNLGYEESVRIQAKLTGGVGTLTYSIEDHSDIVSIDQDGWVTAKKKEGSATVCVTATVGNLTLRECRTIYVWGAWDRKGFSWKSLNEKMEEAKKELLPKVQTGWEKIKYTNEEIVKNLKETCSADIQVVPRDPLSTRPASLDSDFRDALIQEFTAANLEAVDFSKYKDTTALMKDMFSNLVDNPNHTFRFVSRNVTYTVATDDESIDSGMGAALYSYRVTEPTGKYYRYQVTITKPSEIKVAMEYMKATFVSEYNAAADEIRSGATDLLGLNSLKSYVQKWSKGKAVDFMNRGGKNWMENLGDRVSEFDQISKDVSSLRNYSLKDTLPKNVIGKITGYQNKLVKFINDVIGLGDCP